MPRAHIVRTVRVSNSPRARQLEAMFDVPRQPEQRLEWDVDLPIEDFSWNVGLIVGPSGCGKTTIARDVFGDSVDKELQWGADSVIDDFDPSLSMQDVTETCRAVGFNTVPAWLRPFEVLSNGEKFRVELARRLLEGGDLVVVDEFTSVVDRQVGKIGSHAVQRYVRKHDKQFVAVTCHDDVIEWLQPDWVFSPAEGQFVRRSLQRRPPLELEIARVPYDTWRIFAPFHYLTADLNRAARCFGLWANGRLAAFTALLHRPRSRGQHTRPAIWAQSRTVTLPDWQGLGLSFALVDRLGAALRATNRRLRTYPAHPSYIRSFDSSPRYKLIQGPGKMKKFGTNSMRTESFSRPCAIFEYCGPAMADVDEAQRLLGF